MLWFALLAAILTGLATQLLKKPRQIPADEPFKHLIPGRQYEIIRSFRDFKGRQWQVGEQFVFKGSSFAAWHDGLALLTDPGPGIPLQWRADAQGEIIDNLADYIAQV